MNFDEPEETSFLKKNGLGLLIAIVILLAVSAVVYRLVEGGGSPTRKAHDVVMIRLPPPPPPPPPQQPTPEQKIVEEHEEKIETPEDKPKDEPIKPPDEPPIGTGIKGDGKGDSFGLSGSGGSGFGGGGGSRFDWYAGQVQRRVADVLRNNRAVREASLSVKVQVWADPTGRISRVELAGSTGDPSLDATLKNEVLTGLQVSEGPPEGMPMPILLRLTAKRPQQAAR
jgi:hypothetical protein